MATETDTGPEITKWYTHARKFPTLIGKTHKGGQILGGPYTPTQLVVGALMAYTATKTTGVWAHFGRIGNAALCLGVIAGTVFALGKLPIGSRNPLRIVLGGIHAVTSPRDGRYRGAPGRAPKTTTVRVRAAIDHRQPAAPRPHPTAPSRPRLSPIQRALAGLDEST